MTVSDKANFLTLFDGSLEGWRMAGNGRFNIVAPGLLETEGGTGLLWYERASFADFILRLEWRAALIEDNSGVFLRFPPLEDGDPQRAVDHGYEVQIDERGFDPATGRTGSPLHRTGAIYKLAPAARLASHPLGMWNEFEIVARDADIWVRLNGEPVAHLDHNVGRPRQGHVGLQNHHAGSRVQFRNLRLLPL
jgi:Domain of Unknown Function (DUF1080)